MTEHIVLYRYVNAGDVVLLETHTVVKRTPKGYVLQEHQWAKKRFVLDYGRKRFAYPTKEEAKASFLARKERQIALCKTPNKAAEAAIDNMKNDRVGYEHRSGLFVFEEF